MKINQLNNNVRPYLENHVIDNFVLDKQGCEITTIANASLGTDYSIRYNHHIHNHWYNYILHKLKYMPPENYDLVLDVCCGSGFICLNIMENNLFNKCYAVDINETQISFLEHKILKHKINNIIPIREDFMNLKFNSESFDCVIGHSCLHHLPNNYQFLREIVRILKPGGVLCLTHEPTVSATYLEGFLGRAMKKAFKIKKRKEQVVMFDIWIYNEKDVIKMLEETGFSDYRVIASGRIATIIGSFIERSWTSLFNRMPPIALYKIRSLLLLFEKVVYVNYKKDLFSSFTILAKK